MTTVVARPSDVTAGRMKTIRDMLEKARPQIALALPKYMSADRIARLALTSILKQPQLLECDPLTLIGAVIQCAQLGLEPGSSYGAHLVPFWNNKAGKRDVQVIPDYRGLMGLARNSEQISTIDAHPVYEKDTFSFAYGADPKLHHVPHLAKDRGEITHFYAVARLKDGGFQFVVLAKWEVDEIRDRYSKAAGNGPWVTNYDEMGKKTCVRRLADYLPARIELLTASGLEAKAEQGIPQDLGALVDGVSDKELSGALEAGKPAGPVQTLVDELKGKQGGNGGTQGATQAPPPADPPKADPPATTTEPSAEEQAQIRAQEQAEAQGRAMAEPETREEFIRQIHALMDGRRMKAGDRSGLQRQHCGNVTLDKAETEKLRSLWRTLKAMGGPTLL